jgi:hypothetical protein
MDGSTPILIQAKEHFAADFNSVGSRLKKEKYRFVQVHLAQFLSRECIRLERRGVHRIVTGVAQIGLHNPNSPQILTGILR